MGDDDEWLEVGSVASSLAGRSSESDERLQVPPPSDVVEEDHSWVSGLSEVRSLTESDKASDTASVCLSEVCSLTESDGASDTASVISDTVGLPTINPVALMLGWCIPSPKARDRRSALGARKRCAVGRHLVAARQAHRLSGPDVCTPRPLLRLIFEELDAQEFDPRSCYPSPRHGWGIGA